MKLNTIKTILLVIFTEICFATYAQSDTTKLGLFEVEVNGQWAIVERATPPISITTNGFIDEIIISNIKYPTVARRMGIEGNTLLEVQIDTDGNTIGHLIIHHIGADTDKELQNLILKLPTTWIPATLDGENVKSKILMLFKFTLFEIDAVENRDTIYKCFVIRPISTTVTSVVNANDIDKSKVKKDSKPKKIKKT